MSDVNRLALYRLLPAADGGDTYTVHAVHPSEKAVAAPAHVLAFAADAR